MAMRSFGAALCAVVLLAACVDVSNACLLPAQPKSADKFATATAYCYALATKFTKDIVKPGRFSRGKVSDTSKIKCQVTVDVLALAYFKVKGIAVVPSTHCTTECGHYATRLREYMNTKPVPYTKDQIVAGQLIADCPTVVSTEFKVAEPVPVVESVRSPVVVKDEEAEARVPSIPAEVLEQIENLKTQLEVEKRAKREAESQLAAARLATERSSESADSTIPRAPPMLEEESDSNIPRAPPMLEETERSGIPEAPLFDDGSLGSGAPFDAPPLDDSLGSGSIPRPPTPPGPYKSTPYRRSSAETTIRRPSSPVVDHDAELRAMVAKRRAKLEKTATSTEDTATSSERPQHHHHHASPKAVTPVSSSDKYIEDPSLGTIGNAIAKGKFMKEQKLRKAQEEAAKLASLEDI
eukprot:GILK01000226.1.p1 GENE.GILK01000226.1~~GILK01000226.1.p1  ORF type:complete len:410 (+),score=48.71 GILK01000226.1:77-1306(+)